MNLTQASIGERLGLFILAAIHHILFSNIIAVTVYGL